MGGTGWLVTTDRNMLCGRSPRPKGEKGVDICEGASQPTAEVNKSDARTPFG